MKLNLTTKTGQASKTALQLSDESFACTYNEALVHQVVTAYQHAGRAGTRAQKTRAQVRGGGAKPWKQKGTGRARAGTSRGPIWRSGGVTFAAVPSKYQQKVNKKMYRTAMRSIVSELIRKERMVVVDKLEIEKPKTKALVGLLKTFELKSVLIIVDNATENLYLAARNLFYVAVQNVSNVDPVSLIQYKKVLITVDALKLLEAKLT